jgi:hypothetical protein
MYTTTVAAKHSYTVQTQQALEEAKQEFKYFKPRDHLVIAVTKPSDMNLEN